MFDWLSDHVSDSPLTYLVLLVACGSDVLVPLVPSETMVIAAGVLAAQSDLSLWLIVPVVALGAFLGDNLLYGLGRGVGDPVAERLFRGEQRRERLRWAERAIARHGGLLILVARFIPGGRTLATFAAGALEMPYRRFAVADGVAAAVWALYAALLGYVGGETFERDIGTPLAATLAFAAVLTAAIELWRRRQRRRGRDVLGDDLPEQPPR